VVSDRLVQVVLAAVCIPVAIIGYLALVEWMLRLLPDRAGPRLRPWLWIGPALGLLSAFLILPLISTIALSVQSDGGGFVGLDNFAWLIGDPDTRVALGNSLLWLVLLTGGAVGLGLALAVLTDRMRLERPARAVLFMPLAISFVAAGVIWRFVFDYRPPGSPQTGTLNGLAAALGSPPRPWLIDAPLNTLALILAAIWMFTGFCLVIISAGLKGLPSEVLEAARVDGASEWQVFRRVIVPLLAPVIAVVATTMAISALKAFDLVYVMTNGNHDTDVIGTRMYKELFSAGDPGRASAIAVVLLIAVLPVMAWNLRVYRRQEHEA
jgi:alpha-glucoside transport system permease protein